MFEIGRICIKTAGREAGRVCTVIAKEKEKDFLLVTGPKDVTKVRRRKCNFRHLEATPFKLEIKENATDEEVLKAYETDDIFAKLKIARPGEEKIRASAERKEKREEKEALKEEKAERKKEDKKEEKKEEHKEHKEEKPKKARAKKAPSNKAEK
jgi:large subunit ribosomal protein L14e